MTVARVGDLMGYVSDNSLSISIPGIDRTVTATTKELKYSSPDEFSFIGDTDDGYVLIGRSKGRVFGQISTSTDVFDIQYLENNMVALIRYDWETASKYKCAEISRPSAKGRNPTTGTSSSSGGRSKPAPDNLVNPVVSVLVLYTPAAAASSYNVYDVVNTVMIQYNGARGYSQVSTEVELAGIEPINFTEFYDEALTYEEIATENALRLSQNETAQGLRESYHADLVITLTNGDFADVSGSAVAPGIDPEEAYAVVQIERAASRY